MKKFLLLVFALVSHGSYSQTYTAGGGSIPDAGPVVQFPLAVSGLAPSNIDTIFGLETVCLNITHTWDADLSIWLQSPDGTTVSLSSGNGGSGDNYSGTCFNGFASTPVTMGNAPFSGTFRAQGFLGDLNNGQPGNGTWRLLVQDGYGVDTGSVISWSLTFGNTPAKPFLFTSSDLPIVVINTGGQNIVDEPKTGAWMGIIYNGPGMRNYLTDPFNNYSDSIGLELRGSTSMGFPQKSYGVETRTASGVQNDTMILGMPAEHDWILSAPYDDKTCMRNVLSYDIANKTGHYASRTKFCELLIDGQYKGIYIMMEKIKRGADRVNISKMQISDTTGNAVTGGYIIKIDKQSGAGGDGWNSSFTSTVGSNIFFQYSYPKDGTINTPQMNYIQSYVDSFEVALNGPSFADPVNGYRKYADAGSFIDYFILNELSKNVDGYRLSTFLYKDKITKGGKLTIGPAWDYNIAWWNADYCDGSVTTGWGYQFGLVCSGDYWQVPTWWDRFMQDPAFTDQLKCRYTELRQTTLSLSSLNSFVDSVAAYLNEAQGRHFQAWPILGAYTWPNPSPIPTTYGGEISALKSWISARIAWLDANMPGTCHVGIAENSLAGASLYVYPNPFTSDIHASLNMNHEEKMKVGLYDMMGKEVYSGFTEFHEGENSIEIKFAEDAPASGIYVLKVAGRDGTIVKKLTKQ